MNNKTIYFPAINGGVVSGFKNNTKHIKTNKSFRMYNSFNNDINKIYDYNKMLVSAGTFGNSSIIEKWEVDLDKNIILGDSGGFQLATGKAKFSNEFREKIFNWLENNTNYAMNLDFPPYAITEITEKDQEIMFMERLDISIKNFEWFYKNKTGKTKYINILQGKNPKHLIMWYNRIKDFDFEGGWAIGSCINEPVYNALLSFSLLLEKGIFNKYKNKRVNKPILLHYLGYTTIKKIIPLFYLQKKLNENNININISFDSSSFSLSSAMGNYYTFHSLTGMNAINFSNKYNTNDMNKVNLPCECGVCKGLTYKELYSFYTKERSIDFYTYLCAHNLKFFLDTKNKIEDIVNSSNNFNFLETIFDKSFISVFKIIDEMFNQDKPFKYIQSKNLELNYVEKSFKSDKDKKEVEDFVLF